MSAEYPWDDPAMPPHLRAFEFLKAAAGGDEALARRAYVTAFPQDPTGNYDDKTRARMWAGGPLADYVGQKEIHITDNLFLVVSVFKPGEDGRVRRRQALFELALWLMIDDVGTGPSAKVHPSMLKLPGTWAVETSPDNMQVWTRLKVACGDPAKFNRVIDALIRKGLAKDNDPGMKGVSRYGRIPLGVNSKSKYKMNGHPDGFPVRLVPEQTDFTRSYTLEEFCAAYGISDALAEPSPSTPATSLADAPGADAFNAELLDRLNALGYGPVEKPGATGVYTLAVCPFSEKHSPGAGTDGSAVFMIGAIYNGETYSRGAYDCKHGHGDKEDKWPQLLKHVDLLADYKQIEAVEDFRAVPLPAKAQLGEPIDFLSSTAAVPIAAADVPAVLGEYAEAWARASGFDASAVIGCGLVATAAMIRDGIQIEAAANTGWRESARLWLAVIAPPGAAKTPMLRAALQPVIDRHQQLVAYNEAAELLRPESKQGAESIEREPRLALLTHDSTVEKLSEVLADNPGGIIYIAEELDSWLGAHDAYRSGGGSKDRGEWLQLFDGGAHQVDRITRGSFFVPNWGVSLVSGTTPDALKKLVRKLPNDGLLQRVIPVMITAGRAPDPTVQVDHLLRRYSAALIALYEHQDTPLSVALSPDAARLFVAEVTYYRELAPACGVLGASMAGHVAKYGAILARLLLVFHALEEPRRHPAAQLVSVATFELTARCVRKLLNHARVFYRELGVGDSAFEVAQRVALYILASRLEAIDRRLLMRNLQQFRDADARVRIEVMNLLVDMAWVVAAPSTYQKGYATHWTVNPRVHALFAKHGEAHRRKREQVMEALGEEEKS